MNTITKKEAITWLTKHISYDGEGDVCCPHCKKIIHTGRKWLYHYQSMAGNLAIKMGFPSETKSHSLVVDIVTDTAYRLDITGIASKDSVSIANRIWDEIYGVGR